MVWARGVVAWRLLGLLSWCILHLSSRLGRFTFLVHTSSFLVAKRLYFLGEMPYLFSWRDGLCYRASSLRRILRKWVYD